MFAIVKIVNENRGFDITGAQSISNLEFIGGHLFTSVESAKEYIETDVKPLADKEAKVNKKRTETFPHLYKDVNEDTCYAAFNLMIIPVTEFIVVKGAV